MVTAFDEVICLVAHAPKRVAQLEWPEEVVCFLEVGADSDDLMDQILDADDVELAEIVLNDLVVSDGNSLVVYLL